MNTSETIILGVISGVITSALIYLTLKIFNTIVIPWYQKITYRGLDISGEWFESHILAGVLYQESTIQIIQTAHKIRGELVLTKKSQDGKSYLENKYFKFEGEFYNNLLNKTCWNKNKKQLGTHNYLMRIINDGGSMVGIKSYYDVILGKIIASETISWNRLRSLN